MNKQIIVREKTGEETGKHEKVYVKNRKYINQKYGRIIKIENIIVEKYIQSYNKIIQKINLKDTIPRFQRRLIFFHFVLLSSSYTEDLFILR